jgi:ATP-binding cassette, subfamily B, bacterial
MNQSHRMLLVRYLRPQWQRAALMTGLLLGSIAFQAGAPQYLRQFIDQVLQRAGAQELSRTAFLFLGVVLAGQLISAMGIYSSVVVAWEATNRLRADLALHCLRLDMRFHHAHLPGEMIQRIDGDAGILGNFFSQFVVQMAANGVLVLVALALIFREDWRAGVGMVIYVAAAFRLLLRVQKAGGESFDRARSFQMQAVGFWEEMLTNREDVKPLGALGYVLRRNNEHMRDMFRDGRISLVLFRAYMVAFSSVFIVGNAIAFALGAYLYGQGQVTIGGVFLLLTYTNLLASKVGNIANQSNDFQQALVSMHRVNELTGTISVLKDGPGAPVSQPAPTVDFENVSFAYIDGADSPSNGQGSKTGDEPLQNAVLRSLSFHLAGGQRLGLLGRTGSGKSTLVRLLFRFYDPDVGIIRLGGVDLRQARLSDLRGMIGLVTQEVQLFYASARDNLTLFDQTIPDERIVGVLCELGLAAWLNGLPDGLDTILSGDASAGNAALSAGEAQLLAMTRVFLQDPRLVILDEASSRLDPATEGRLERAVDRLLEGRTAIIIAHRLNTLRRVDQLLVLGDGTLVEYGARERMERDPASQYHRLLQLGMDVLE